MASHVILKFLAGFADVLNTAKGTLNDKYDKDK